jgi:gas vesicle protein
LFSNAYAHTFTPDDSASFLALIYRIKNEAQLVRDNLLGNATTSSSNVLAEQHAKSAISILNETWAKEIAGRNRRIANELNGALSDLHDSIGTATKTTAIADTSKPIAGDIKEKVSRLNDLLDEAISVRLTKDQVNNSTIQALTLANIANKIDRRYANALGVGYNDMSSMSMGGAG